MTSCWTKYGSEAAEVGPSKLEVTGVCVLSVQNAKAEEDIHVVIETPQPIDAAVTERQRVPVA